MECKTCQYLLTFVRPGARELDAEESRALEAHLNDCPACLQQAGFEQAVDRRLARAMQAVTPPAGLRGRITARLRRVHRQRVRRRWLAAAAAVLLLGSGLAAWLSSDGNAGLVWLQQVVKLPQGSHGEGTP